MTSSENHKNELGICPECYYYVLVYYKTGFEEKIEINHFNLGR